MTDASRRWRGRACGWRAGGVMLALSFALSITVLGLTGPVESATMTPTSRALTLVVVMVSGIAAVFLAGDGIAASIVNVTVSSDAVRVRPALMPLTGIRIPIHSISAAAAVRVPSGLRDGWGWWWSGHLPAAVTVRSGPALALRLVTGRQILISVDDPHAAVEVLHRLMPPEQLT
jgi:hypothetical protein